MLILLKGRPEFNDSSFKTEFFEELRKFLMGKLQSELFLPAVDPRMINNRVNYLSFSILLISFTNISLPVVYSPLLTNGAPTAKVSLPLERRGSHI